MTIKAIYVTTNVDEFQSVMLYSKPYETKFIQSNPMKRQHLVLIDSDGQLFDFKFYGNKTFSPSWKMVVPKSDRYFGFTNERKIFIMYGHQTEMTYLKSNEFHRTIPNSQFPKNMNKIFFTTLTHFNNHIWLIGGGQMTHRISYIWSIKESKWTKGPSLGGFLVTTICLLPLNRHEVMVFGLETSETRYVRKYDFSKAKWFHIVDLPTHLLGIFSFSAQFLQKKNYEKLYQFILKAFLILLKDTLFLGLSMLA